MPIGQNTSYGPLQVSQANFHPMHFGEPQYARCSAHPDRVTLRVQQSAVEAEKKFWDDEQARLTEIRSFVEGFDGSIGMSRWKTTALLVALVILIACWK